MPKRGRRSDCRIIWSTTAPVLPRRSNSPSASPAMRRSPISPCCSSCRVSPVANRPPATPPKPDPLPKTHSASSHPPLRPVRLGPADVVVERRGDGAILLRSPHPLPDYPKNLTQRLVHWAAAAPDRVFLAQRDASGGWRTLSYAQALAAVRAIAAALLARDLSVERPIAILSGNDIEHGLLGLAAMHVG